MRRSHKRQLFHLQNEPYTLYIDLFRLLPACVYMRAEPVRSSSRCHSSIHNSSCRSHVHQYLSVQPRSSTSLSSQQRLPCPRPHTHRSRTNPLQLLWHPSLVGRLARVLLHYSGFHHLAAHSLGHFHGTMRVSRSTDQHDSISAHILPSVVAVDAAHRRATSLRRAYRSSSQYTTYDLGAAAVPGRADWSGTWCAMYGVDARIEHALPTLPRPRISPLRLCRLCRRGRVHGGGVVLSARRQSATGIRTIAFPVGRDPRLCALADGTHLPGNRGVQTATAAAKEQRMAYTTHLPRSLPRPPQHPNFIALHPLVIAAAPISIAQTPAHTPTLPSTPPRHSPPHSCHAPLRPAS
jgi:hypothetical protein